MYAMCPPKFIKIENECYYISREKLSWLESHFACKDKNSKLAEPMKFEDRALRKFLLQNDKGLVLFNNILTYFILNNFWFFQ